jgi:hypothetical protein
LPPTPRHECLEVIFGARQYADRSMGVIAGKLVRGTGFSMRPSMSSQFELLAPYSWLLGSSTAQMISAASHPLAKRRPIQRPARPTAFFARTNERDPNASQHLPWRIERPRHSIPSLVSATIPSPTADRGSDPFPFGGQSTSVQSYWPSVTSPAN